MCIMINRRYLKLFFLSLVIMLLQVPYTSAQTAGVKKAAQSIFTLTTFKTDGSLLASSHGVFVDTEGNAISSWKPFVGAAKAVVIDAQGKKYDVEGLVGANDIYDVCKFKVNAKTTAATIATVAKEKNSKLWLMPYSIKAMKPLNANVTDVETFMENLSFYILDVNAPEDAAFCPLVTDNGDVVALLAPTAKAGKAHGVDARLAAEFYATSMSSTNTTLQKSAIPIVLPVTLKDAQFALILASQQNNLDFYKATVNQFIKSYPHATDGYVARARIEAFDNDYTAAERYMSNAIDIAEDKADQHYNYSRLIVDRLQAGGNISPEWTADTALKEIRKSIEINDLPIYRLQEANILTLMGEYNEAYEKYMALQNTHLAGPETLHSAYLCLGFIDDSNLEKQVDMLDKVIEACPHPLTFQSGNYILEKAILYHNYHEYRKAFITYNEYEKLMVGNNIPDAFYFSRFECCRDGKFYQQAIDDITKAINLNPRNPIYFVEKGALLLRLGKSEEAIAEANKCLLIAPDDADALAILGTAQCLLGKNYEGVLNLERAKTNGYTQADELIKKYKK